MFVCFYFFFCYNGNLNIEKQVVKIIQMKFFNSTFMTNQEVVKLLKNIGGKLNEKES